MWKSYKNATVLYRGKAINKSSDLKTIEWNIEHRFSGETTALNDYVYNTVINEEKWLDIERGIERGIAPYNLIFFEKFKIQASPSLRIDMKFDEVINEYDIEKPLQDFILSISNAFTRWVENNFNEYVYSLLQQTVGESIGVSFSSMSNLIEYTFEVVKKSTWNTIKMHLHDKDKLQWDRYKNDILDDFTLGNLNPTIKLTPDDIDESVHLFIWKMKAFCLQFLKLKLMDHIYTEMDISHL